MKNDKKNIIIVISFVLSLLTHTINTMDNQLIYTTLAVNAIPIETESLASQSFLEKGKNSFSSKKRIFDEMESDQALALNSLKKQRLENQKNNAKVPTRIDSSKKTYTCLHNDCGRSFKQKNDLSRHERTHTGEKSYICTYDNCGRSFILKGNLIKHEMTHTGERPYICTYDNCSKSFTQQNNLKRHQRIHTGEKPYTCKHDNCGKLFTNKGNLNRHKKIHARNELK